MSTVPTRQLVRLRWAVRAVLLLGVTASVAGNILHARDNPISQAIAAWPPLALLLAVELISRVPVHRYALATVRWLATAVIASIAAWVSYTHMVGVAFKYGENGASPYLLPLSVDGLIVVASVCLVELGGRIRADSERQGPPADSAGPSINGADRDAPNPHDTAGQRVRRDERATDDVTATIRALAATYPDWSLRRLGVAAGRSEATVRRALGPGADRPVSAPPADGREPEMATVR